MKYITRIIDMKEIRGSWFALTSGSIHNVKPTGGKSYQPFQVISEQTSRPERTMDITGNTCMENDVLCKGYKGRAGKNDFLVFPNKGAYTNVFRPPFIHYAPPILELNEAGDHIFVRWPESVDNILSTYKL
jgi:diaminopimelate decarboxylase